MAEEKEHQIGFRFRVDDRTWGKIALAIRHDYLISNGAMKGQNLSEWLRFLINKRMTELTQGRR